jgi:hypothetical protein
MYFWKIGLLRERLGERGLSQSALFVYIFLFTVINAALIEFVLLIPSEGATRAVDFISPLLGVTIIAAGTYFCYRANGGGAGREFAERFFSIGFVVGLRVLVVFIAALTGLFMILIFVEGADADPDAGALLIETLTQLFTIGYYWRVITHMSAVAGGRKS